MTNRILFRRSTVAGSIPTASEALAGEIFLNQADGNLFALNTAGSVVRLNRTVAGDITAALATTGLTTPTITFTGAAAIAGNNSASGITLSQSQPLQTTVSGSASSGTNEILRVAANNGNSGYLRHFDYRNQAGTSWSSATRRVQYEIDATPMAFIEFNNIANPGGISLGAGNAINTGIGLHVSSTGVVTFPGTVTIAGATSAIGGLTVAGGATADSAYIISATTGNFGAANASQMTVAAPNGGNAIMAFNSVGSLATKIGVTNSTFVIGGWSLPTNAFQIDIGGNSYTSGAFISGSGLANSLLLAGNNTGNSPYVAAQGSDANINLSYISKGAGQHYFNNEINITPSAGYALRITAGGGTAPSTLLYSDGGAFYIMKTAANDPNGTFDAARPFAINLTSGVVAIGNGLSVTGQTSVGDLSVSGALSANIDAGLY